MDRNNETGKKNNAIYWICFVLAAAVTVFLAFYKLNVKYVDPWDEARHGVNAWEMLNGGSLIQSTFLRQADYYNLKPPLSMWGIMIGLKLFRDPVFGLRFYSAVCYIILVIITGLFFKPYSKKMSICAMLALGINMTPFLAHMVRAGDADSLYVLLFSVAMLSMMKIRDDHRFLYICGFSFSLAFLAKSFHALLIAAVGGLFLILTKQLLKIRFKEWLIFILTILLPVTLWAVLRYRMDGDVFFRKMWETDVLGRTTGVLHNNIAPFTYYFSYYFGLMSGKLQVYLFAVIIIVFALGFAVFQKAKQGQKRVSYIDKQTPDSETQKDATDICLASDDQKKENTKLQEGFTGAFNKRKTIGPDELIGFALWICLPFLAFSAVSNKLLWYQYPSVTALMIAAGAAAAYLTDSIVQVILPVNKTEYHSFCHPELSEGSPSAMNEAVGNKPGGTIRYVIVSGVYILLAFIWLWYYAGTFAIIDKQDVNDLQMLVRAVAGDKAGEEYLSSTGGSADTHAAADVQNTADVQSITDAGMAMDGIFIPDGRYISDNILKNNGYKNCRVYIDYDGSQNSWQQQDVFVAEAYGGFECANGGIIDYLVTSTLLQKKGIAIVSKQMYENCGALYDGCPLLAASDEFMAFEIEY